MIIHTQLFHNVDHVEVEPDNGSLRIRLHRSIGCSQAILVHPPDGFTFDTRDQHVYAEPIPEEKTHE